ncbi:MAG: Hsp20/alpha crystallin family protein [Thermodesulfobacteriota bacterium]
MNFPTYGLRTHFEELDRMRRHLDQVFQQVDPSTVTGRTAGVFPLVNLTETQEAYILRAELPGVSAEDLDIQTMGRNITVSGERRIAVDRSAKYHRREREGGRFSRAIALPGEIDRDKVAAALKNGILQVTIPKAEAAKPRKIDIK